MVVEDLEGRLGWLITARQLKNACVILGSTGNTLLPDAGSS